MADVQTHREFAAHLGPRADRRPRPWRGGSAGPRLGAGALVGVLLMLGAVGCEADSFLDPSVTGRWEATPTRVPILERLASIEDADTSYVEVSPVTRDDLIPDIRDYHVGPGDVLDVRIRDFYRIGQEEQFQRVIDQRGFIDIPRLPPIRLQGKTEAQIQDTIAATIRERQIQTTPVVSVVVTAPRQQTFSAIGGVRAPGVYTIPRPDYKLLDALTAAQGFDEGPEHIYVIRQVPLSEEATGGPVPAATPTRTPPGPKPKPPDGEHVIDLIDELSKPKPPPPPPGGGGGGGGSPGAIGTHDIDQPAPTPKREPPVDLTSPSGPNSGTQPSAPAPGRTPGKSEWVFLNGQWVKTGAPPPAGAGLPEAPSPMAPAKSPAADLVTQRVIEVPTAPLVAGAAEYNVVVRAGDVIRVPPPPQGLIYVDGQVVRPGPYSIPSSGRITLTRAVNSAGGLGNLAIPERVDLTRMVGHNHQAIIQLNLRAIAKGTQPDIYLKPDDRINVGTNFWAFPLAVFRSGFRASYGFGFILDRNFEGDVFGINRAVAPR